MVELPDFFNKVDFFGKILPGYVAMILYLVLFRPDVFFGTQPELVVDIFLAVVFLVAGPAAGLSLQHLHRYAYTFIGLAGSREAKDRRKQDVREYARVRLKLTTEEKLELDQAEAEYDFSMSTGLALFLLLLVATARGALNLEIQLLLLIAGLVFVIGGLLERKESYSPLFRELSRKYPAT